MKEIPGYPNYLITEDGRVWSRRRGTACGGWLKQPTYKNGYRYVNLCVDGIAKHKTIHRLVLLTFVGPCPEGMEGCHNDGERSHNWVGNLRWDTRSNNHKDAVKHGTAPGLRNRGINNWKAKLDEHKVRQIRREYGGGATQGELLVRYGVSHTTINDVVNRKSWKHVTDYSLLCEARKDVRNGSG